MFGLGAGELLIIAVVVLLALGPDKLPAAAKKIGAGIRDLKKQTRNLQNTLEQDTEIGEAMRDLKYAMRGQDPPPPRPKPRPVPTPVTEAQAATDSAVDDAWDADEPAPELKTPELDAPELDAPEPGEPEPDEPKPDEPKTSANG